jgi:hypothetical protein
MLTRVSSRFSKWEPIDTFKCENRSENRPQFLTWLRTGSNVYMYFLENRTGSLIQLNPVLRVLRIIYWFLLCFFSLRTATLLLLILLFFSYSYYSSPMIVLLFLLLLLFSHYYSSLFIAITFFSLLLFFSCCFSCMVLFFHVMK